MSAFYGLLGFDTLIVCLIAAGITRGHARFTRKPAPRKPPGGNQ